MKTMDGHVNLTGMVIQSVDFAHVTYHDKPWGWFYYLLGGRLAAPNFSGGHEISKSHFLLLWSRRWSQRIHRVSKTSSETNQLWASSVDLFDAFQIWNYRIDNLFAPSWLNNSQWAIIQSSTSDSEGQIKISALQKDELSNAESDLPFVFESIQAAVNRPRLDPSSKNIRIDF